MFADSEVSAAERAGSEAHNLEVAGLNAIHSKVPFQGLFVIFSNLLFKTVIFGVFSLVFTKRGFDPVSKKCQS